MAKPILIIKLPSYYDSETVNEVSNQLHNLKDLKDDYHMFIIPNNGETFDFKVFNGEYTESEYKKLEELIENLKK